MGQEVVYCYRCLSRLVSVDFEKGRALRLGNRVTCLSCAPELLSSLSPDEQKAFLKEAALHGFRTKASEEKPPSASGPSNSGTSLALKAQRAAVPGPLASAGSTSSSSRSRALVVALVVGLVLVGILLVGRGNGTPPTELGPRPAVGIASSPSPTVPEDPRLRSARAAIEKADREVGGTLERRIEGYQEAVRVSEGTSLLPEAKEKLAALLAEEKREFGREAEKLEKEASSFLEKEEFRAAAGVYDKSRALHDTQTWSDLLESKLSDIRQRTSAFYEQLSREAAEAQDKKDSARLEALRAKAVRGGYPNLFAVRESALGIEAPSPPKVSPAEEGYRLAWRSALGKAAARDFRGAASSLKRFASGNKDDHAQDTELDVQWIEGLDRMRSDALALVLENKGAETRVEFWVEGKKAAASGRPARAAEGLLDVIFGDRHRFVDSLSLDATFLAQVERGKTGELTEESRRRWAILCLLEGDAEGARELLGAAVGSVPERYWTFAEGAGALLPRLPAPELEAMRLLNQAEEEVADPRTTGLAIEKYQTLQREFATTNVVKGAAALFKRRLNAGRDYLFSAEMMRGSGTFHLVSKPPKSDLGWSSEDVPPEQPLTNGVDLEYFALPGLSYRAWVFAGACCQETFTFGFQATDQTVPNARKELVPAAPGDRGYAQVKPSFLGLRATHASHGGPKEPKRWEWISLPLPKAPGPGVKKLRILSTEKGFTVSYVVLSSTRGSAPDEGELRQDLEHLRALWRGHTGLVARWKLDEGAGTTIQDSSGAGHSGGTQGRVVWDKGVLGGALRFDGSSGRVDIPDALDLRLRGDLTISLWVKRGADSEDPVRLLGKGGDLVRTYGLWLSPARDGSRILFQQWNQGGKPVDHVQGQTPVEIGTWHHVAGVVLGDDVTVYLDGRVDAKGKREGIPGVGSEPLTLGSWEGHAVLTGLLDDIRIYDRALPTEDIELLSSMIGEFRAPATPIVLSADKATIHGGTLGRYGQGEDSTLQGWNSTECSAEWTLEAPRPGRYKVEVLYACEYNNGGTFSLSVGDEKVSSPVPPTAGWNAYAVHSAGTLVLPRGKSVLLMKASEVKGGLINLKQIKLIPAF